MFIMNKQIIIDFASSNGRQCENLFSRNFAYFISSNQTDLSEFHPRCLIVLTKTSLLISLKAILY
jgi:hypothetical protein